MKSDQLAKFGLVGHQTKSVNFQIQRELVLQFGLINMLLSWR